MILLLFSCQPKSVEQIAPIEVNEQWSGGQGTVFDTSSNAFTLSFRNLSREQRRAFAVGNSFFNDNWVTAPASTTSRDGLGPLFNAHSCSSCHFRDGRAAPPYTDSQSIGLLFRIRTGDEGPPVPDPNYGEQIQDKAILNVLPEATVTIQYTEKVSQYRNGDSYSLITPTYFVENLNYGDLHPDIRISPRIAPAMFGVGLLEAIPEDTLKQLADPDDQNQDGISGKINWVDGTIGRFGWKASASSVAEQTAGAFLGDIGITSSLNPEHNHTSSQQFLNMLPTGGEPEIDQHRFNRMVEYQQLLAVPGRRNWEDTEVRRGKQIFLDLQCAACHIPTLRTGTHPIAELEHQIIHPYTDLLLHDMGPDLADDFADHNANGREWRTPPLWGLGLQETVSGHTHLLHDGRARNISEAILWHGGEAAPSKERFVELSTKDRQALLEFLSSL